MCTSARFPESIPFRNIKAIQSDQGSSFMSAVFQQVIYDLGIHQYKSSAYHPESQGAIEQFHQSLKNDDCIDRIGQSKFVYKFDLLKGFWQSPITEKAKEILGFSLQYKVIPFGMKNSPATFLRLVNKVTFGLDGVGAYIDDVIMYSNTWEEHLRLIRSFFDGLSYFQLTLNFNESEFCHGTLTSLGHVVGQGQVKPSFAKFQAMNEFLVPSS